MGGFDRQRLDHHLHALRRPPAGDREADDPGFLHRLAMARLGLLGQHLLVGDERAVDVGEQQGDLFRVAAHAGFASARSAREQEAIDGRGPAVVLVVVGDEVGHALQAVDPIAHGDLVGCHLEHRQVVGLVADHGDLGERHAEHLGDAARRVALVGNAETASRRDSRAAIVFAVAPRPSLFCSIASQAATASKSPDEPTSLPM